MAGCLVWEPGELGRLLCSAWNPYGKTLRMALVWYLDISGFLSKNRMFFFMYNVLDNYLRCVVIWIQEWWYVCDHLGFKNHVPPHDVHETSRSWSFFDVKRSFLIGGGTLWHFQHGPNGNGDSSICRRSVAQDLRLCECFGNGLCFEGINLLIPLQRQPFERPTQVIDVIIYTV